MIKKRYSCYDNKFENNSKKNHHDFCQVHRKLFCLYHYCLLFMPLTKVLNPLLGRYFNDFLGSQTHRHKQFSVNFNSAYTHMCTVVTNIVWLHLRMYTSTTTSTNINHWINTATQLTQGKPLDNSIYEVVYGITWLTYMYKCGRARHVLPYIARPTGAEFYKYSQGHETSCLMERG